MSTVLLIDDSKTVQRAAQLALAKDPTLKIETCNNADEALKKTQTLFPQLILVDHALESEDGYQVAARLKNNPDLGSIPVILLVGPNNPPNDPNTQKAIALGIAGTLVKPFDSQQLVTSIKSVLEHTLNPKTIDTVFTAEQALPPFIPPTFKLPDPALPPAVASLSLEPPSLTELNIPPGALTRESFEKSARQIIEEVVWEVVPELAEAIIREEINRLLQAKKPS